MCDTPYYRYRCTGVRKANLGRQTTLRSTFKTDAGGSLRSTPRPVHLSVLGSPKEVHLWVGQVLE